MIGKACTCLSNPVQAAPSCQLLLTLQSQGFKFSFCSGRLALYLQGGGWGLGGKQPRQPKKTHNKNTLNRESIAFKWGGRGLESVL